MDQLTDDAILTVLTSITNVTDLVNMCKSSKRIKRICDTYKQTICRSILVNMGYTNFSNVDDSPCDLFLNLRSMKKINKKNFRRLMREQKELARFISINGKVNSSILYDIASDFIMKDDLEGLKNFHRITGYNFATPRPHQSIMSIASDHDHDMFQFILENGGNLDERDYSEDWEEFSQFPEYAPHIHRDDSGQYYITSRGLILADPGKSELVRAFKLS